ncbi:probable WRKY transcription factor 19 [Hevea brasiliensis]|uniref:probable WRKY transcription factor 19 n=1 Tax=Hevea brasiliensis TaxID=3981 RepID=UPI0025F143A1|nr:probable WRKY transcription factor 19 [Hevea brasiliensis]
MVAIDGDGCGSGGGGGGGDGDSVVVLVVAVVMVVVVVYQILMASSSSSSSSINPQWKKYDAFISFRGADIREGFLSDLVYDEDGFVGIDSRVKEVESLLCLESEDVLMIEIWGMGGIGETTIADKVCNGIANKFESRCFIANVREELEKRSPVQLRDEILGKILKGENFYVGTPCTLHPFIKRSLHNRRVLIVLDEVDDYLHLTDLVGGWNLYGPGSRVIVTSRDKQVLEIVDCKKCIIYEVEKLNDCESLRLFSLHAFKQPHPAEGYMKQLPEKVISYTQGVPLALKVLGSNLYGKSVTEWESELKKLETIPSKKIQGILRRSYDELDDNERNSGIRSLLDKSLVNISEKKGAESVEAISLDMSKIKNMELCPSAFEKFYKLRLLKFYNPGYDEIKLHLPRGLKFLPNELRFLYWDQNPLKYLPSKFCPENLFLENLKLMDLRNSKQLIRIPDPLKFPKLEHMQSEISKTARHLTLCESPWIARELGGLGISGEPDCNEKWLGLSLLSFSPGLWYIRNSHNCKRLQFLREFPSALEWLDAENCTSLEFVSSTFIQGYMNSYLDLDLSKCINLDQSSLMDCLLLKLQSMGPPEADATKFDCLECLCIARSEVPKWMMYKNHNGSSLSFSLTTPHATDFIKIAFCALFAPKVNDSRNLFMAISCKYRFMTESGDSLDVNSSCSKFNINDISLWYSTIHFNSKKFRIREASFQFYGRTYQREFISEVKHKCGVHLMFDHNLEDDDDDGGNDRKRLSAMVAYERADDEGLFFTQFSGISDQVAEDDYEQYPERHEFKGFDLNFALSFLFTLVICLAANSDQTKAQPTRMIFALMLICVCLKLLSFNSSLSLHGMRN